MGYTYTIDNKNNSVRIFSNDGHDQILLQPGYPNKDQFETPSEAEDWAKLFIASLEDKNNPFAPIGRGILGEPQETEQDILNKMKLSLSSYGDNAPQPLIDKIAELENTIANAQLVI